LPEHHTPLIATIAFGLVLAFVFGLAANRLRVSPLVGYLLAGIAVGPFTPGFVADQDLADQLAEVGVILLMFAVGLHFSLAELMSVRAIALPGAVVQIAAATLLGIGLAWSFGWDMGAGLVFGLALSVASTVVLTRALQERHILETERGRIAVGWLIVEDLAMVLALVLLPVVGGALAGGGRSGGAILGLIAFTLAKVAAFVAVMLIAGRRVIPWLMHHAAHTGSRELFRLAVYAVALGVAYAASALFGVSFALAAFFAGMVMSESQLSQRAAEEAMPLRDAFAVLFFVSVGMLFDPNILVTAPLAVLATLAIIVVGKSAAALLIVRAFGHPWATGMTIAASLAQIGEFSFILVGLGVALGMLSEAGRGLVLAGAILSILINPFLFAVVERRRARLVRAPAAAETGPARPRACGCRRIAVRTAAQDGAHRPRRAGRLWPRRLAGRGGAARRRAPAAGLRGA
jgi:CPA2 family monovalent cation:H+ antiporter-2